jgi:hypothetical protein
MDKKFRCELSDSVKVVTNIAALRLCDGRMRNCRPRAAPAIIAAMFQWWQWVLLIVLIVLIAFYLMMKRQGKI